MSLWEDVSERVIDLLTTEWEFTDLFVAGDTLPNGMPKRIAQYKRGFNIGRADPRILAQNINHGMIINPGGFSQTIQGAQRRFARNQNISLDIYTVFRGSFVETMDDLQDNVEYVLRFLNQFPILTLDRNIYNTFAHNSDGIGDYVDNSALSSLGMNGLLGTLDNQEANVDDYSVPTLPSRDIILHLISANLTGALEPGIWSGESKEFYIQKMMLNYQYNYSSRVVGN